MDKRTNRQKDRWTKEQMDKRTNRRKDRWTNGWMNGLEKIFQSNVSVCTIDLQTFQSKELMDVWVFLACVFAQLRCDLKCQCKCTLRKGRFESLSWSFLSFREACFWKNESAVFHVIHHPLRWDLIFGLVQNLVLELQVTIKFLVLK
jgi:hypothetical protein